MGTGEIYLDFAAIMFTVFCGAFVYLVLYLHKEGPTTQDRRRMSPHRAGKMKGLSMSAFPFIPPSM